MVADSLTVVLFQHRLGNERVDITGATVHEAEDDAADFRREVRLMLISAVLIPGVAIHVSAAVPSVEQAYPNKSMIGLPVVRERDMPLASCGLLMGMSRAW